jgi:hypothetical protein
MHFIQANPIKFNVQGVSFLPENFERKNKPYAIAEYDNSRASDKMQRRFPGLTNPLWRHKVLKAVRDQSWKMIWGSDGTRELYAIKDDPYETQNVASQFPDQLKSMEQILANWLSTFEPSRYYKQEEISREALEELRSLGYVQ